ncbi:SDR family oxidoreductase [Streptomyces millisiae]|uniref:SDR family oxidoreductase n=1 Tax=Streptomyces millisiae TaxID=3075542 RepID=A0ABU2LZS5_9ACTN|nr:SDR family oxidoreductase [Streptomyces sp. DSM 44918]MDT0323094.1 SDR family oxidoreductase [Streptomyces sp. DSM 44918]
MSTRRHAVRGRVAVITGGARGIGAALARTLSERGATVALVGLEPDASRAVAASLPGPAEHWDADVTDEAAMAEAARRVGERFGRVDVVVANAGVAAGGRFADSDDAGWRRVVEVNVVGSAVTCRAFLPALRDSRGYFLQIASLAALTPAPLMTAYCASKSAVEAFAHGLRPEVADDGVRVGVAYLSWTDTDLVRGVDEDPHLRLGRSLLPWPTNRTNPLQPAVERLADGIERRAAHVYGQRWVRAAQPLRPLIPAVLSSPWAVRRLRRVTGNPRHTLVGPSGRAATRPGNDGD